MLSHSPRLQVLWLSHFVPFPPKGGCFQRSYNLIKRVAAVHDLHLVALRHKRSTHPQAEVEHAREELLRHCRSVEIVDVSDGTSPSGLPRLAARCLLTLQPFNVAVYRSNRVREHVRRLCAAVQFDVAHFDTIGLAQYLPDVGDVPALMTHHGAESHMIRRRIARERNAFKTAFFLFEWPALRRYERLMCPRFDSNVVMSLDDAKLMAEAAPDARYTPVENGVDTNVFAPIGLKEGHTLVFAGRLDQYSNRDGILYFLEQIWPALLSKYPDAIFHVIGNNPPGALRKAAASDGRLKVHGFVPDIGPYFSQATVAVCPLRDGGGTRIKILDALAQGMPIVSTTVGCEGLSVTPERDVLIADSPEQFVRQISRVFEDAGLRQHLASNARRLAEGRYSWDFSADKLLDLYEKVAQTAQVS